MRNSLLALAVGAALAAVSTPVSAAALNLGWDGLGGGGFSRVPMNAFAGVATVHHRSLQQRYDVRMLELKAKLQRLTDEDGGQLTEAHEVSLRRELDGVNRWFGIKPARG